MSLERGFPWSYQDWNFTGYTLAGITTSIYCRNAGVCFDVGQGLPFQNGAKTILITHAHMDHAAGLPYLIAQKNMAGQKESRILVPPSFREPIEKILEIWQGVDGHRYEYQLEAAEPGHLYPLDKLHTVKAFPTVHRVPSQGYLLYRGKKRLKESFRSASREAILAAKAGGEEPEETVLDPMVAFTGDTQIEFIGKDPDVGKAKILFVEVTFWDEAKPVMEARRWGHLHLDELLEALPRLENERIVLIHASVRYSTAFLQAALDKRLRPEDRERVVVYPRPV